jgi:hypothetical protein
MPVTLALGSMSVGDAIALPLAILAMVFHGRAVDRRSRRQVILAICSTHAQTRHRLARPLTEENICTNIGAGRRMIDAGDVAQVGSRAPDGRGGRRRSDMLMIETVLLLALGLSLIATGLACCVLATTARAERRYGRGVRRAEGAMPAYRAPSRTRPAARNGRGQALQSAR